VHKHSLGPTTIRPSVTFWLLFLAIDGQFVIEHPYHYAFRETCAKVGLDMVKKHKYEAYKCVKEVRE
jgi:hypothetical protein